MLRDNFARIVVEHMNETQPEYLSAMVKDDPTSLKQFVDARVKEAMLLNKQYNETTSLYQTEINELINAYLAPAEDLPEETVEELSSVEINRIIQLLNKM